MNKHALPGNPSSPEASVTRCAHQLGRQPALHRRTGRAGVSQLVAYDMLLAAAVHFKWCDALNARRTGTRHVPLSGGCTRQWPS